MQKKYMELSQNSVMHVFEHFCECIEESDFNSVLSCILASLRNVRFVFSVHLQSNGAVSMFLLRILDHFLRWVSNTQKAFN